MIIETKIDEYFHNSDLFAEGYRIAPRDRNMNGAQLLCTKENISNKLVNTYHFSEENEVIAIEFSISKEKWYLLGIYKSSAQNDLSFLSHIVVTIF